MPARHRLVVVLALAACAALTLSPLPGPEIAPTVTGQYAPTDHGADAPPPGVDVTEAVPTQDLLAAADLRPVPGAARNTTPPGAPAINLLAHHVTRTCYGDGSDGNRVQVLYARERDQPDRYAKVLPVLQHEVATVDDTFALSARKTGGGKRVRWVTDAGCTPVITPVVLPDGALGSNFAATVSAIHNLGYTAKDRKYLIFSEGTSMCGIAQMFDDTRKSGNLNDGYAALIQRVDQGCWSRGAHSTAAHELMHSIGGVTSRAPHASGALHCNDDWDLMCYPDGGARSNVKVICPDPNSDYLFDCKDDDYFHTDPAPDSFLGVNWNTADSSFLADAAPLSEPVTVRVSASVPAYTPGRAFTLTASAPGVAYSWSGPYVTTARTGRSVTVAIPAGVTTAKYTVRVAATDGVASYGSTTVAAAAAPAAATTLTITQSTGTTTRVTGVLRAATTRAALRGVPLTVQARRAGTGWWNVTTIRTSATGAVTHTLAPRPAYEFRFVFTGTRTHRPAVSATAVVKVPTSARMSVRSGRPNVLTATVTAPTSGARLAGITIALQARRGTGAWSTVTTAQTRAGVASVKVQPRRGTYYRWVVKGSGTHLSSTSKTGYVRY
jgi:hypothetical protein